VRSAVAEQLGPLREAVEALLAERGMSLQDLAPPRLPGD
jgi:hypothetical protein